jgi:lichenan operon transcriptional antiterminator
MSINILAARLNVSDRTIRNDIKQINEDIQDYGVIEGDQGKVTLRIFQEIKFQLFLESQLQSDDFLNSYRNRIDYIFGKLMRSDAPVLTDELAYEMNLGRTTLVNDIKKLRTEIEPYHLSIQGRTSKGLSLEGREYDIRQYVIDQCYEQIYRDYPLDREIITMIEAASQDNFIEKSAETAFKQFVTLMLDRYLTGCSLTELPEQYYTLASYKAFASVETLINEIGECLGLRIPLEEKIFVFLPIIGMRTPADIDAIKTLPLDDSIRGLMQKIIHQIGIEMEINIIDNNFSEEFLYHLMFMVNRLRFGVRLTNPMLIDIQEKYRLAYQMGKIAAKVVEKELNLVVTDDEKGYLASYFVVFLAENDQKKKKTFQVAVVCGNGRVTAGLIKAQLKKVLDSSVKIVLYADEAVDEAILNEYDIVLSTITLSCKCNRPVIYINEIFNERELMRKIEKAKYWDDVEVPVLDNNWFVMTDLLDETRFFILNEAVSYDDALQKMVNSLVSTKQVDNGFLERLRKRERKGTVVFDNAIAIPHGVQYSGNKLVLSVGVFPIPMKYNEHEIKVIFLLGLPEKVGVDDNLLIRIYDEIMSLAQDRDMMDKLSVADSFSALLRVLYRQS